MRVHEATTEKKGSGKQQPYEKPQTGTRTKLNKLIAIPNIAARLKMPPKTNKKMGTQQECLV